MYSLTESTKIRNLENQTHSSHKIKLNEPNFPNRPKKKKNRFIDSVLLKTVDVDQIGVGTRFSRHSTVTMVFVGLERTVEPTDVSVHAPVPSSFRLLHFFASLPRKHFSTAVVSNLISTLITVYRVN